MPRTKFAVVRPASDPQAAPCVHLTGRAHRYRQSAVARKDAKSAEECQGLFAMRVCAHLARRSVCSLEQRRPLAVMQMYSKANIAECSPRDMLGVLYAGRLVAHGCTGARCEICCTRPKPMPWRRCPPGSVTTLQIGVQHPDSGPPKSCSASHWVQQRSEQTRRQAPVQAFEPRAVCLDPQPRSTREP